MSIRYLSNKEIITIHYATMKLHDDLDEAGIKYQDRFEAMLARPYSDYFGVELFEKACCYYHSIAKDHIFYNGNKRTALVTFATFLKLNGMNWNFTNKKAEDFTVYLATAEKFKTNDAVAELVKELSPSIIE